MDNPESPGTPEDKASAEAAGGGASGRLDLLLDVPLDLTVELGRTKLTIENVLSLQSGSVIELDKIAGDPLDILLNGRLVARGEAVVVGEKFGIRVTSIVSPSERLARLQ